MLRLRCIESDMMLRFASAKKVTACKKIGSKMCSEVFELALKVASNVTIKYFKC